MPHAPHFGMPPRLGEGERPHYGGQSGQQRQRGHVNVITKAETKTQGWVFVCMILLFDVPGHVLFDSGALCSFVFLRFAHQYGLRPTSTTSLLVSLPLEKIILRTFLFEDVLVFIGGVGFYVNLPFLVCWVRCNLGDGLVEVSLGENRLWEAVGIHFELRRRACGIL